MARARQLREKTTDQLVHELVEIRKELLDRSVRASAAQDETGPSRSQLRGDIARILTIVREREIEV
ncbi:MAG: 50S ribosomal protein L29 [Planctomycetota bacterium]|nr:50S ribosomal protein L29 [Planctomycetota bacterium]